MPNLPTPEEIEAVTAPFLAKIQPEPVVNEREQWEQERAGLLKTIDEATAKILNLESDLSIALDALRELASQSAGVLVALEGAA